MESDDSLIRRDYGKKSTFILASKRDVGLESLLNSFPILPMTSYFVATEGIMQFAVGSEANVYLDPTFISEIIMSGEEGGGTVPRRPVTMNDVRNLGKKNNQDTSPLRSANGASGVKTPSRCWCCKSCRLRVVEVANSGRRILECANLRCMATIEYTDLPTGTTTEHEKASEINYGWYLRDTAEMVYPTPRTLAMFPNSKFEYIPEVLYDSAKRIVVRCPGERKLIPLD